MNRYTLSSHFRLTIHYIICASAALCFVLAVPGCSPDPAEHLVRDAIHSFFKKKNIQVEKLEIQSIEQEPLGQRQYMGPKRYFVNIPLITLQKMNSETPPTDYRDALITIRKNTTSLHGWTVESFSETGQQ